MVFYGIRPLFCVYFFLDIDVSAHSPHYLPLHPHAINFYFPLLFISFSQYPHLPYSETFKFITTFNKTIITIVFSPLVSSSQPNWPILDYTRIYILTFATRHHLNRRHQRQSIASHVIPVNIRQLYCYPLLLITYAIYEI